MSATHSSFGLNALKCLLTRSAGHWSFGAERVVLGDLVDCQVFFGQYLFSYFRLPSLSLGTRVRPR